MIEYRLSSDDEFDEIWGRGVRAPSVLTLIPAGSEDCSHDTGRGFFRRLVGLRVIEVVHHIVEKIGLNRSAFLRRSSTQHKLMQQDPEKGRAGEVERRFLVFDRHHSISVGCVDTSNEERMPVESQGSAGIHRPKSQAHDAAHQRRSRDRVDPDTTSQSQPVTSEA